MRININPYYVGEKEKNGELYNKEIQRVKELSANIKRGEERKMKERFTTLQVLILLTERGDVTFETVTNGRKYKAAIIGQNIVIVTEGMDSEWQPITTIPMDIMWVEQDKPKVKKVVTFLEAAEALHNGKDVYCMFNGVKVEFKSVMNKRSGEMLVDVIGIPLTTNEILEGEWFINE